MGRKLKASDVIALVEANDPGTTSVDLSGSTIFQMKHIEYARRLASALPTNCYLTELKLNKCGITDGDTLALAHALAENTTLLSLSLEGNSVHDAGGIALAEALEVNSTLREINLFGQQGGGKWGEPCLASWVAMYEHNITLLKIVWRTESRQTVTLTRCTGRNTDINRAIHNGSDYVRMLPMGLRHLHGSLAYYELPDIKTARGGVAKQANKARSTGAGMVMRNGVADKVAASGTVMSRLAAMRAGGDAGGASPTQMPWVKPPGANKPTLAASSGGADMGARAEIRGWLAQEGEFEAAFEHLDANHDGFVCDTGFISITPVDPYAYYTPRTQW